MTHLLLGVALLLALPLAAFGQSMSIPSTTVAPTTSISVSVANNSTPYGYVGLFRPGDHDLNALQWKYMNNAQAFPGAVIPANVLTFTAPATTGAYEFRLFAPSRGQILSFTVSTTPSPGGSGGGGTTPTAPTGRIAFNGDSITDPTNITGSNNWAAKVAAGLGFTQMINLAANSKYTSTVIQEATAMSGAAVCVIMIGTNDMTGSLLSRVPATQAREAYLYLMRQVIQAHKPVCGKVVIVTPPFSFEAFEAVRYAALLPRLRELCAELAVTHVDLWQHMADLSMIQGPDAYTWWNNRLDDPRHPNVAGHAMIADFVLRSLSVTR